MTAAAVALRGYVLGICSKQVRGYVLGIRSEKGKLEKGKKEKRKIKKLNEQNIFLSRDSCRCRAKRLRTGDLFEASKRLRTGDSFGKRKIGKRKKGKNEN